MHTHITRGLLAFVLCMPAGLSAHTDQSLHEKVSSAYIEYVAGGDTHEVVLDPSTGIVMVPGYVVGIRIDITDDATVLLNGQQLSAQKLRGGHGFRYSAEGRYMGQPLLHETTSAIQIRVGSETLQFTVYQRSALQLFKNDAVTVMYFGDRADAVRSMWDGHIRAVMEGVQRVEEHFRMNAVDTVYIIDYEREYALADLGRERTIYYYTGLLEARDAITTRVVAEHEALHWVWYYAGYDGPEAREYFAKLRGISGSDYRLGSIMSSGASSTAPWDDITDESFFDFVNESSYFGVDESLGHSYASVFEFYASFYHSLMYIDRLGDRLAAEMVYFRAMDGADSARRYHLSHRQQCTVLGRYMETLQMLRALAMRSAAAQLLRHRAPESAPDVLRFSDALDHVGALAPEKSCS